MDIQGVECATSGVLLPHNWNINTGLWLRHYVYERLVVKGITLLIALTLPLCRRGLSNLPFVFPIVTRIRQEAYILRALPHPNRERSLARIVRRVLDVFRRLEFHVASVPFVLSARTPSQGSTPLTDASSLSALVNEGLRSIWFRISFAEPLGEDDTLSSHVFDKVACRLPGMLFHDGSVG